MAVMLASAVLKLAVAKLGSAIGDQVTMLCSFKDDLGGMKDTLESMVASLRDAERRSIRVESVRLWLKRLKNAAYDICDMLDEFQDGTKTGLLSSFTIVPKITNKMRKQLSKIDEDHKKFGFSPDSSANNEQQFTASQETSKFNQEDIVGRGKEKKEIVALLSESSTKEETIILPIHGLAGIGKTTLARLVYNDCQFKKYDHRVWVYVSQVFDLRKIGCSIISQLSDKESESLNDGELIIKRLDELILDKKILIILDDLWEERYAELEKLKTMLNVGKNGSKIDVIVTTRKEQIARKFWTGKSYNLKPLIDTECWDIIKKKCDLESKPEKEQLKQIGLDIAKKCGGVALAAQALGYMLSEMNLKEWKAVRDSDIWNDPCHDDENSPENSVFPPLMLSYKSMPLQLRLCFAYCAIFPKGQNIAKDNLIHQWIALDLIKPSNTFPASQLGSRGEVYQPALGDVLPSAFKVAFDCARYLIQQGEAFRGYNESSTSMNTGNFRELVDWYIDKKADVKEAFEFEGAGNCLMLCPDIQKELAKCCAQEVTQVIKDEIGDRNFAVLIDESRDSSIKEHMSVIVRFVNKEGKIMERFIGIEHVTLCTCVALK